MIDFTDRSTVVGVFDDRHDAENAVEDLRDVGFLDDQIGILAHRARVANEGVLGATAVLLTPGSGPIVAGGILGSLAATAVVGTGAGGLVGTLVDLGVPEAEAYFYDHEFRRQRTLVIVQAETRYREAQEILHCNHAYDLESRSGGEVARCHCIVGDTSPSKQLTTHLAPGRRRTLSEKA
jgi:hypothetical protein